VLNLPGSVGDRGCGREQDDEGLERREEEITSYLKRSPKEVCGLVEVRAADMALRVTFLNVDQGQ
jgi:hypothetical protein